MHEDPAIFAAGDLTRLRTEQAQMLNRRIRSSCLLVEFIIAYTAVIMAVMSSVAIALQWFAAGTAMVAVTYAYAKLAAPDGITRENVAGFLRGHRIVSAITGLVWGGFAIYQLDYASEVTILIACLTVCSITLGGIFPSSAYRATYVALASTSIPPLGFYIAITAPGPLRLIGFGLIVYFLFAMFISARVEIQTRETIAARNARALNDKVIAQNRLYLRESEEKTRFLAATGHDLSQPLQSQGFFLQALRDVLTTPRQRELLERVEESWRAQKDLLRGIVDVSRIDSGAIVPRIARVELAPLCRELADEFRTREDCPELVEAEFDEVTVATDPVLLARILRNLLSNARKFTPASGEVRFTARATEGSVRIAVSDTGPGIAREDRERVFDEYVRLDQSKAAGLGLGLPIVQRLCDLLDIELQLESEPGQGTTFHLRVPQAAAEPGKRAAAVAADAAFSGAPLVLVVDDDDHVADAMARVLTAWKCQVLVANGSAAALELVEFAGDIPALMIVDKRLGPNDDGVDLIAAVREECNAQIPAILMSGDQGNLSSYDGTEDLFYFNKPVEPGDLKLAMRELLSSERLA